MNIIGIDTSTEACSVAVRYHEMIVQEYEIIPNGHSNIVLKMVEAVLQQVGIKLVDLDAIAVDTGPGSFTGVRIGMGVAQGLAYGTNLSIVGVCSLEVLAASRENGIILPAIDARMNQIYCGLYEVSKHSMLKELSKPMVVDPNLIPIRINSPLFGVGSGWDVYSDQIMLGMGDSEVRIISNKHPEAQVLVEVAREKGIESAIDPMQLRANYIRNNIVQN